jgi:hypothetical protein
MEHTQSRMPVETGSNRPIWHPAAREMSAGAEQAPQLEMADGKRGVLEQPGQLGLDDLRRSNTGAVVDDKAFLVAERRQRLGPDPAAKSLIPTSKHTFHVQADSGKGIGHKVCFHDRNKPLRMNLLDATHVANVFRPGVHPSANPENRLPRHRPYSTQIPEPPRSAITADGTSSMHRFL